MEFSRREYWIGLPYPSPDDLANQGTGATSPEFLAFASDIFTTEPPGKANLKTTTTVLYNHKGFDLGHT